MIKNLIFEKVAPNVATPRDIAALEAKVGVKLPPTFHEFCFRWNGGYPGKANWCYAVPSSFTEFYEKYYFGKKTEGGVIGVDVLFGATKEFKQCDVLREFNRYFEDGCFVGRTKTTFIPIGSSLMGDLTVLRTDSPAGMVYWIDPDTWEMPEGVEWGTTLGNPEAWLALMPIAENLESFYNALMSDPDENKGK